MRGELLDLRALFLVASEADGLLLGLDQDRILRRMLPLQAVIESLDADGIACTVYDRVRV